MALLPRLPAVDDRPRRGCMSDTDLAHSRRWDATLATGADFAPAMTEICRRHGLDSSRLRRFPDGTCPVFAAGDAVIKLYPPLFLQDAAIESACLRWLGRHDIGVATPRLIAAGSLEGWPYLVMSRLPGRGLDERWEALTRGDKERLIEAIGESTARLHALPPCEDAEVLRIEWSRFMDESADRCRELQLERGLDAFWADQIDAFIAPSREELKRAEARSLLHTELLGGVWLTEKRRNQWNLSGLFDFGEAWYGPPEYDDVAVGLFITCGDRALFRRYLQARGVAQSELTPERSRRLMILALLHRYSNLSWYLRRNPPRSSRSLDSLAERWFAL